MRYMTSPFYTASVVLFQLHGSVVSHMQVTATPLLSDHNIKYSFAGSLPTESILVLAACSGGSDVASGADR